MRQYTIDALSHFYNVLPDWVGETESDEFVEEFLELAAHDNKREIKLNMAIYKQSYKLDFQGWIESFYYKEVTFMDFVRKTQSPEDTLI